MLANGTSGDLSNKVHKSKHTSTGGKCDKCTCSGRICEQTFTERASNLVFDSIVLLEEGLAHALVVILDDKGPVVLRVWVEHTLRNSFILIQSIEICVIDFWLHDVANSVMTGKISVRRKLNSKVLSNDTVVLVEVSEVQFDTFSDKVHTSDSRCDIL